MPHARVLKKVDFQGKCCLTGKVSMSEQGSQTVHRSVLRWARAMTLTMRLRGCGLMLDG